VAIGCVPTNNLGYSGKPRKAEWQMDFWSAVQFGSDEEAGSAKFGGEW
jgi:hypothetical protein